MIYFVIFYFMNKNHFIIIMIKNINYEILKYVKFIYTMILMIIFMKI
jgi:hypothetical protein